MSSPLLNPPSVRFPFNLDGIDPKIADAFRWAFNGLTNHEQAFAAVASQISSLKAATSTLSTTTENITQTSETTVIEPGTITGGQVNDQTGQTSYATQQSDNGGLIALSNSSPIAVTLNSSITLPYSITVANQGTGTATLTPSAGTVNGASSFALAGGQYVTLYVETPSPAGQWWAVTGKTPSSAGPTAHEWLSSYDATTAAFTLSQPGFTDLSGQIAPSTQMPASGVTAGSYTLSSIAVNAEGLVTAASSGPTGVSGTVTLAQLTNSGSQGSLTVTDGIITAIANPS